MRNLRTILSVIGLITVVLTAIRTSLRLIILSGGLASLPYLIIGKVRRVSNELINIAREPSTIRYRIMVKFLGLRAIHEANLVNARNAFDSNQQYKGAGVRGL